jgi:hypothetical protein
LSPISLFAARLDKSHLAITNNILDPLAWRPLSGDAASYHLLAISDTGLVVAAGAVAAWQRGEIANRASGQMWRPANQSTRLASIPGRWLATLTRRHSQENPPVTRVGGSRYGTRRDVVASRCTTGLPGIRLESGRVAPLDERRIGAATVATTELRCRRAPPRGGVVRVQNGQSSH